MPLFDVTNAPVIPGEKKVPIGQILAMHRARFAFTCSLGTMRLRRLTLADQEATIMRLEAKHPEYFAMSDKASLLWHILDSGQSLSPEQQIEFDALAEKLTPFAHEFSAKCFEDPIIHDGEELGFLLFEMQPEERGELLKALSWLANPSPDGKIETVGLLLAKEYGIKLADDLTIENMTALQATALTRHLLESRGGGGV